MPDATRTLPAAHLYTSPVGHLQLTELGFTLADGRVLLRDVTLKVSAGDVLALVGPNGAGKTTLTRIVTGDVAANAGNCAVTGRLGVMRQFIGSVRDQSTVADLLLSLAPPKLRALAVRLDAAEKRMNETGAEKDQLAYADAVIAWGDEGGYELETLWDVCTVAAFGIPFDRARDRAVTTLSGGEQKRLALEALLRGDDEVLILDEPDNYLDVPGKRWLEEQLIASRKAILLVSHDRELLNIAATRIATLERHATGSTLWVHSGPWSTYREGREARNARLAEDLRRWDEEHARIKELVRVMQERAKISPDLASRYQAAQTKLRKFEEAGKPEPVPLTSIREHAPRGRPHREASRRHRESRTYRAHEAVRRGDLVRRPGGTARIERIRQVTLLATPRGRWLRPGRRTPARWRRGARTRGAHRHGSLGRSSASGLVRANARASGVDRPRTRRDPAPRGRSPRRPGTVRG